MARIALSLPQFTEPVSGAVRWSDETAGLGDVSDLRASAGCAHLTSLLIRPLANGRVVVQVRETLPGRGAGGGPDLTTAWEQSPHALTLRAPGVSDLVIPGPDHASSANRDTTEPYGWRVAAASIAAHTAWRTAFLALTPAQRQAAQLILDDGGTLAGIARSRIRTRGALGAAVRQGVSPGFESAHAAPWLCPSGRGWCTVRRARRSTRSPGGATGVTTPCPPCWLRTPAWPTPRLRSPRVWPSSCPTGPLPAS